MQFWREATNEVGDVDAAFSASVAQGMYPFAWTVDGSKLAHEDRQHRLFVWDVATNSSRHLVDASPWNSTLYWSHDGNYLLRSAVTGDTGTSYFQRLDVWDERKTTLIPITSSPGHLASTDDEAGPWASTGTVLALDQVTGGTVNVWTPGSERPRRMIAFGDSFTSGEGKVEDDDIFPYDCATDLHLAPYFQDTTLPFGFGSRWRSTDCDTRTLSSSPPADLASRPSHVHNNLCHRHARAYPNQIRAALGIDPTNYIFVACSGARTQNVGLVDDPRPVAQYPSMSPINIAGGKTQIATVDPDFTRHGLPDLVTIGIGGNDAKFIDIIKQCMNNCLDDATFADDMIRNVNNYVFRRVRETLRKLRAKFVDATVVAFGYPSVIGDPDMPCARVGLGGPRKLNRDELLWARNQFLPALNDAIADAASEAGVVYADIFKATEGHELCSNPADGQRWINGARTGDDELGGLVGNESFHPNEYAHDHIAEYFLAHNTDASGRLTVSNPDPGPPTRTTDDFRVYLASVTSTTDSPCATNCVGPSQCAGQCHVTISATGLAPESVLHVWLDSQAAAPRASSPVRASADLATLSADEVGTVNGQVAIPTGTPTGVHAVTLRGTTADGFHEYGTTFIEVVEATEPMPPDPPPGEDPGSPATTSPSSASPTAALTDPAGVPIGLPLPTPSPTRRVVAAMSARWRAGASKTRVTRLVVSRLPAGATVAIQCAGPSHSVLCKVKRRQFAIRRATKRLALTKVFAAPLPVGTKLTLSVTRPAWIGQRWIFKMRARRQPKTTRQCLPVGSAMGRRRC